MLSHFTHVLILILFFDERICKQMIFSPPRFTTDSNKSRMMERGFTMIELVMVLAVIAIITTLAYPSMQSIMHRKSDLEVAAQIVETSHKIRAQAMRRNRAYGIHIHDMEAAEPKAIIDVTESISNLCEHLLDPTKRGFVLSLPLGQAEVDGVISPKEKNVGISGWRHATQGVLSVDDTRLCFTPSGSIRIFDGVGYVPLTGVLEVAIQPFNGNGNWVPFGPPRFVEFTFASGAQIIRK